MKLKEATHAEKKRLLESFMLEAINGTIGAGVSPAAYAEIRQHKLTYRSPDGKLIPRWCHRPEEEIVKPVEDD